jgi:hypothetical protein
MNRRRFLTTLAGSLAALAVPHVPLLEDPERALWQPGKVKVFDLGAMPKPCERVEDKDLGISIRFLRQWDHNRMDVLYGLAALRPDLAVRVIA